MSDKHIFKIKTLSEDDIDDIITSIDGEKIDTRDREKNAERTADYILNDVVIELKMIDEEGLNKTERREKLAALFNKGQQNRPTVILHPHFLEKNDLRNYYRILETPIKTHIRDAVKQLKRTEETLYSNKTKVLLIINNGYTTLDIDTFEKICFHRVKNDTTNIDYLIVAGIYFYGDGFDFYSLFPFKLYKITDKPFFDFERLREAWNNYTEKIITTMILEPDSTDFNRLPVCDVFYDLNGKYYVNPTPPIGKKSKFYRHGRPRKNSTNIEVCPPVAKTFPLLDKTEWILAKSRLIDDYEITNSYEQYYNMYCNELKQEYPLIQPFVPIPINYNSFKKWCISKKREERFHFLCIYANEIFDESVKKLIFSAQNADENKIVPAKYIYVVTEQIGQDRMFDISAAYIINQSLYINNETCIFENINLFHEYALSLACSYAIKNDIDIVYYKLDQTFGWH